MSTKAAIRHIGRLAVGVRELDAIPSGGLPQFSVELTVGAPRRARRRAGSCLR